MHSIWRSCISNSESGSYLSSQNCRRWSNYQTHQDLKGKLPAQTTFAYHDSPSNNPNPWLIQVSHYLLALTIDSVDSAEATLAHNHNTWYYNSLPSKTIDTSWSLETITINSEVSGEATLDICHNKLQFQRCTMIAGSPMGEHCFLFG